MPENKRVPPPHHKPTLRAYPNYAKALITQRHKDPLKSGITRGAQTGLTGAVLGSLIARMVSDRPAAVGAGAALGGVAGALPGYASGVHEANSDNSKMLFLRRRMGVNEPGELDALLQNPELLDELTQEQKSAQHIPSKAILSALGAGGAGAGAGYLLGTHGTAKLIGYADDPAAKHVGGYVNAANVGSIGAALALAAHGHPQMLKAFAKPGIVGGMAGMEVIPSVLRSANHMSDASQAQADAQIGPTATRLLNTPMARGAAVGTGLAGLTAIVSGLRRAKTEEEIKKNRSRSSMIGHDFLKNLVPAAVGGGVVGSLAHKQPVQ